MYFQVDRLSRVSVVDGGVLVLVGVAMSQCLVDGTSNGCLASLQSGGMAIISNSTIYEESCDVDEGWLNQVWRPAAQQHGLPPWTTPGSRWGQAKQYRRLNAGGWTACCCESYTAPHSRHRTATPMARIVVTGVLNF